MPVNVSVPISVPVPVCVSESVYAGPRERKRRIAAQTDAAKEAEPEAARPDTVHVRSKDHTQSVISRLSCLDLS